MRLPGGDKCHTNLFTKWQGMAGSILAYAEARDIKKTWMKELDMEAEDVDKLTDGKN